MTIITRGYKSAEEDAVQGRKTDFRTILIIVWALLGGYELHAWAAGDAFPPQAVVNLLHVGLATLTVVYAIARSSSSAQANVQLGREIERARDGGTSRGGLRSVEEVTR